MGSILGSILGSAITGLKGALGGNDTRALAVRPLLGYDELNRVDRRAISAILGASYRTYERAIPIGVVARDVKAVADSKLRPLSDIHYIDDNSALGGMSDGAIVQTFKPKSSHFGKMSLEVDLRPNDEAADGSDLSTIEAFDDTAFISNFIFQTGPIDTATMNAGDVDAELLVTRDTASKFSGASSCKVAFESVTDVYIGMESFGATYPGISGVGSGGDVVTARIRCPDRNTLLSSGGPNQRATGMQPIRLHMTDVGSNNVWADGIEGPEDSNGWKLIVFNLRDAYSASDTEYDGFTGGASIDLFEIEVPFGNLPPDSEVGLDNLRHFTISLPISSMLRLELFKYTGTFPLHGGVLPVGPYSTDLSSPWTKVTPVNCGANTSIDMGGGEYAFELCPIGGYLGRHKVAFGTIFGKPPVAIDSSQMDYPGDTIEANATYAFAITCPHIDPNLLMHVLGFDEDSGYQSGRAFKSSDTGVTITEANAIDSQCSCEYSYEVYDKECVMDEIDSFSEYVPSGRVSSGFDYSHMLTPYYGDDFVEQEAPAIVQVLDSSGNILWREEVPSPLSPYVYPSRALNGQAGSAAMDRKGLPIHLPAGSTLLIQQSCSRASMRTASRAVNVKMSLRHDGDLTNT